MVEPEKEEASSERKMAVCLVSARAVPKGAGFGAGDAKSTSFGTGHAKRCGPRLPVRRPTCRWLVSVLAVPKAVVSARAVPTPR